MTDHWLAINLCFWLSALLIVSALYIGVKDPEPYDYRIAVTAEVEA